MHAAARPRLGHRPQHQRAGAVAEQDTGAAIVPVENARKRLGADHQRGSRLAEPKRIVGGGQRKDETGAHRLDIEGGAPVHPQPRLHLGRGRGKRVVRGRGGEDDQIEVAALHAGGGQRLFGGAQRQVGGQFADGGDPAFADPGALADPFVRGVEAGGQFVIGDDSLRQVGAASGNLRSQRHLCALTGSPAAASRPPDRGGRDRP